jgi:PAS domain-containing protein
VEHLRTLIDLWPAVAAVAVAVAGWLRWGRRVYTRVVRSLALSDKLHDRFGETAADALSVAIHDACVEGSVREVRVQILEETLDLCIYICDSKTGECTRASRNLAELFGMDADDFRGNGWLAAIDHDEKVAIWDHWQECVENKLPYSAQYHVTNQRTGERFLCTTVATPAKLKTGEIVWYVGLVERVKP